VSKFDRRKRSIAITDKGLKMLSRFEPKAERAQAKVLEVLTSEERKQFMALLARLVEQNNEFSRAPIRLDE
jgi:DNA-binding MarR family transcriptional regulator